MSWAKTYLAWVFELSSECHLKLIFLWGFSLFCMWLEWCKKLLKKLLCSHLKYLLQWLALMALMSQTLVVRHQTHRKEALQFIWRISSNSLKCKQGQSCWPFVVPASLSWAAETIQLTFMIKLSVQTTMQFVGQQMETALWCWRRNRDYVGDVHCIVPDLKNSICFNWLWTRSSEFDWFLPCMNVGVSKSFGNYQTLWGKRHKVDTHTLHILCVHVGGDIPWPSQVARKFQGLCIYWGSCVLCKDLRTAIYNFSQVTCIHPF